MHISEGILSGPVLISGVALAAAGTAIGLKKLDYERIPRAAILAASFFVASLIHVPVGPSSVHLILNGIVGLILGWGAFPVILVALVLQAIFFQFGGITTLGVNTMIMA
ncbi:MAG TPA: cobalt transporter CbiM, partial [Deltaproteobacteria bacterium]|nr:cobalt transporter CbiM [Deltaproteobacteria bacterium]